MLLAQAYEMDCYLTNGMEKYAMFLMSFDTCELGFQVITLLNLFLPNNPYRPPETGKMNCNKSN